SAKATIPALLSFSMMFLGVPFGANMAHQGENVRAGNPASAAVGISGAMPHRFLALTMYALMPPDLTWRPLTGETHIRSMCPANKSCTAVPSPRLGTNLNCVRVSFWNSAPRAWFQTVVYPSVALPEFAFNQAISSCKSFADMPLLA